MIHLIDSKGIEFVINKDKVIGMGINIDCLLQPEVIRANQDATYFA